jgi:hypothetical protein
VLVLGCIRRISAQTVVVQVEFSLAFLSKRIRKLKLLNWDIKMSVLSPEILKEYREIAFDRQPEAVKHAEDRGFYTGDNPNWKVTKAYRDNYDSIRWSSHDVA